MTFIVMLRRSAFERNLFISYTRPLCIHVVYLTVVMDACLRQILEVAEVIQ